jgi:SAM-dependent methyltransferase
MARPGMDYDAPIVYEQLIAPRYAPIADTLLEDAKLRRGERVLELGAGTGLVTRRAAQEIAPGGSICATDLSPGMLGVARQKVKGPVNFVLVDYAQPLPFLDGSFDAVLSGLTYVQNSRSSVQELRRVLRPRGRLALVMWGTYYGEVRMMTKARLALGQPAYPSAAPGRTARRLEAAGFRVRRRDLDLAPRFASVDDYLAYRRGFGVPVGSTCISHERYLAACAARRTAQLRRTARSPSAGRSPSSWVARPRIEIDVPPTAPWSRPESNCGLGGCSGMSPDDGANQAQARGSRDRSRKLARHASRAAGRRVPRPVPANRNRTSGCRPRPIAS